jgi:hypothetical protein
MLASYVSFHNVMLPFALSSVIPWNNLSSSTFHPDCILGSAFHRQQQSLTERPDRPFTIREWRKKVSVAVCIMTELPRLLAQMGKADKGRVRGRSCEGFQDSGGQIARHM